jgi:hypothetical protein
MRVFKSCAAVLLAILELAPRLYGQGTLTQVLTNGPADQRINIVFLSEGYLASQTNQFAADARAVLAKILNTAPFNGYSNYFNAFSVFVPSVEAGSDHPSRSVIRNTYFNSTYDSYGIARLVTIPPNDYDSTYANGAGKVDALLQNLMPQYDLISLIVNDTEYGGSGGRVSITSVNTSSAEIAIHEMGHSYSGLGDEYDSAYPGYPDTEEPNTTRETDRNLLKWNDWVLTDTPIPTPETSTYGAVVGLFEGAHYHATGWYRPKLDCKMKSLSVPFCEVCSEALVKSTYGLIRPIVSNSPSTDSSISVASPETVELSITCQQPATYNLKVQWFTNSVAVPGATNTSIVFASSSLADGMNEVRAEATDPTSKVRSDPLQVLKDARTWQVDVQARPVLEVHYKRDKIILSWPSSFASFVLESRTNLSTSAPWVSKGVTPVLVGARFNVTNTVTGNTEYYRLRR